MKKTAVLFTLVLLLSVSTTYAQSSKITKSSAPSPLGLSFLYSENGFGPFLNYYSRLNSSTQLVTGIGIMSVSDSREFEQYDIYGNKDTPNKENRVFLFPVNIGIKKEIFGDDITGSIRPIMNLGITPALVLTNPYSREYFNAMGYFNAGFAIGGFAGLGLEFRETQGVSFALNVNYAYVTPVGKEINSLYNKPIKNLAGLQLGFGVRF